MKTTTYTCDKCGKEIEPRTYYGTHVKLNISSEVNSNSEPEKNRLNKELEIHLCLDCHKDIWGELLTILNNFNIKQSHL